MPTVVVFLTVVVYPSPFSITVGIAFNEEKYYELVDKIVHTEA